MADSENEPVHGLHCLTCHSYIVSLHRHHFVQCSCPVHNNPDMETYIYVDGGRDYFRAGAGKRANFQKALFIQDETGSFIPVDK